jgi:predicted RNA-binding Zn ribbon-like protein
LTVSETETIPSDPGEPAPGELELVRAFVNTRELDPDREEIAGPAELAEWLDGHGIDPGPGLGEPDVARARDFREAIRRLLIERDADGVGEPTLDRLRAAAGSAPTRFEVASDGSFEAAPAGSGVDALVARVLAVAAAAQERGEWDRLKVCTSDECLWAFYDRSRNRSRHWCSMEVCGNRAKTRAYRAKRS